MTDNSPKWRVHLGAVIFVSLLVVISSVAFVNEGNTMSIPERHGSTNNYMNHTELVVQPAEYKLSHGINYPQSSNLTLFSRTEESPSMMANTGGVHLYYSSEPAPMGIADYGLGKKTSSGSNTYELQTPAFIGHINISSLSTYGDFLGYYPASAMSIQLNTVLVFTNNGSQYIYWIQNVAELDTHTKRIYFEDAIWNTSSNFSNLYDSSVSGNGEVYPNYQNNVYLYFSNRSSLPGSNISLSYPASISMEVLSYETSSHHPAIAFLYDDGYGWQIYDNVSFPFATTISDMGFVVNGNSEPPNPFFWKSAFYYDAEFVLAGPSNGFSTVDQSSNVSLQLEFWNGHNFQEIRNAYDFGSQTAETISNVSEQLVHPPNNGALALKVTNGKGTLGQIYDSDMLSTLIITSPYSNGTVSIGGQSYNLTDGELNLTLFPGTYPLVFIAKQNNSMTYWNATVTLTAGKTTSLAFPPHANNDLIIGILVVVITLTGILAAVAVTMRRRKKSAK